MDNKVYMVQDLIGNDNGSYRSYVDAMMHVGKLFQANYYQPPKSAIIYYAFILTLENGEIVDCEKFATNRNRQNPASPFF